MQIPMGKNEQNHEDVHSEEKRDEGLETKDVVLWNFLVISVGQRDTPGSSPAVDLAKTR